jgi:hypothetical protein
LTAPRIDWRASRSAPESEVSRVDAHSSNRPRVRSVLGVEMVTIERPRPPQEESRL